MQVPVVADQPLHRLDGAGLGLQRLVPGDERGDGVLAVAGEDLAHPRQAERLDPGPGPLGQPALVPGEGGGQPLPVRLGQRLPVAQKRLHR